MKVKRFGRTFKNNSDLMLHRANGWYNHYYSYLQELAFQLIEWENLPETINPNFLEQALHLKGYVAFYEDKNIGFVAVRGALGGRIDKYDMPLSFKPAHNGRDMFEIPEFKLFNYNDDFSNDMGVLINNTDRQLPTTPSIEMFAQDLTEIRQTIYINQNAQKTPYILKGNDKNKLSVMNLYQQIDDGVPAFVIDKELDSEGTIDVLNLDVPYVVDKLATQKNNIWNEFMTFMGISNANQDKKERMITAEADSNNEQVEASANRFLKARQESVDKINEYFGLNIKVKLRQSAVDEMLSLNRGGGTGGEIHNASVGDSSETVTE